MALVEAVLRSCSKKTRKRAVMAVTSDSYTALHYAAAVGSEEIVRLLLAAGASKLAQVKNKSGSLL